MKTRNTVLLGAMLLLTQIVCSQSRKIKFGKIEKEYLEMTEYALDTSAAAVVLSDLGRSYFIYNDATGINLNYSRHLRIKILDKAGYDYANFSIEYYTPQGNTDERVGSLKGLTHNVENGKLVTTKLTKEGVFDEEKTKSRRIRKVTFPNVKEGSIIELKYTISSPYFKYFRDWNFQYEIPAIWSEYRADIPEYFGYQKRVQGYLVPSLNETSSSSDPNLGSINRQVIGFKDVPAFKEEPYMTSKSDYMSKILFELSSISIPGQVYKDYSTSWSDVNKYYLESSHFGETLKAGFAKKIVEGMGLADKSDEEKIATIINHIKSQVQWNGSNSDYVPGTLKKAYDNQEGNSAEVNMLLVLFFRAAGLSADPVLLSTRKNGFIRTPFPNSDQFNYTLCLVETEKGGLLVDGTDPYLPMHLIPEKCLNGEGWRVCDQQAGWVKLRANEQNSIKLSAKIELGDDGEMTGSFKKEYKGYHARNKRKNILSQGEEAYKEDMIENSPWEIDEITFDELTNNSKSFSQSFSWESEDGLDVMGGTIYLSPMFDLKFNENVFKSEKREYPVDYGCPEEQMYFAQIQIPEGYSVSEKPENAVIALPSKGGRFVYQITVNGNQITVMSRLNINKALFIQNEYPALKQFYSSIVSKHAEQIVLKKT